MAFFYYVLCVLCLHFSSLKCHEFQRNGIDSNFGIHKENSLKSLEHNEILSSPECDCGPNSENCEMVKEEKVCKCKFKFRQVGGSCEPFCESWYICDNGSPCVNESCQCLPGTRGDFCETVDECEGGKGAIKCGDPDKINCFYDSRIQKAACKCRIYEYLYDESRRKCFECDCNKQYGSCSLVDGVKSCKCNPGTALRPESLGFGISHFRCTPCDCGNNSNGCSFKDRSGLGSYWTQVCDCKGGYYEQEEWTTKTCEKCECGPHGTCYTIGSSIGCNCDDGYKPFLTKDRKSISCKECDCGGNGLCSFLQEVKQCKCDKSFAERDGKCVACQCYANDETVDCYFDGRTQHCLCPKGYENGTFFCKDINECLNPDVCPHNTHCVNIEGSFECPCVKGYEPRDEGGDPKVSGCDDIDECKIESMCPPVNTLCTNLPGTYKCECKEGYEPVLPYESPIIAGCQPRRIKPVSSPWKTPVIIVGVIFGLCVVGLGIAFLLKRRFAGHQPRRDTALRSMR